MVTVRRAEVRTRMVVGGDGGMENMEERPVEKRTGDVLPGAWTSSELVWGYRRGRG